MSRLAWWLVARLSRTLDPDERDAVRGDFAESGESGGRALCGLLGLVARRQLFLWLDWRPWLALLMLVYPVGLNLTFWAIGLSGSLATRLWAMWHAESHSYVLTTGEQIAFWAGDLVLVPVLAWTAGFVLASISRRTASVSGALFCLWWLWLHSFGFHYFLSFAMLMVLLEAPLLFLPAILGVRRGLKHASFRMRLPLLLSAAIVIAIITQFVAAHVALARIAHSTRPWLTNADVFKLEPLPLAVICWPVLYLVAAALQAHRRFE
ncbi:MAG TPA: hypothetical protein VLY24_24305 [Bryobacteraceae bacterium]|nr:hypothetical protein [Bryobacteraceae bacterium]